MSNPFPTFSPGFYKLGRLLFANETNVSTTARTNVAPRVEASLAQHLLAAIYTGVNPIMLAIGLLNPRCVMGTTDTRQQFLEIAVTMLIAASLQIQMVVAQLVLNDASARLCIHLREHARIVVDVVRFEVKTPARRP